MDQAVVFSVMSCRPDFAPAFDTPYGSRVTLQDRPLSRAESLDDPIADEEVNSSRWLTYVPWITGSSPNQFIESGPDTRSYVTSGKNYFVGVNGACADTDRLGLSTTYSGNLKDAPVEVALWRQRIGANFYAETYGLPSAHVDESGALVISSSINNEDTSINVTPYQLDLPPKWRNLKGTQMY